jgi:hypothetical protein
MITSLLVQDYFVRPQPERVESLTTTASSLLPNPTPTTTALQPQQRAQSAALDGESTLDGAVVASVALEALAETGGGVARSPVGALADVLIRALISRLEMDDVEGSRGGQRVVNFDREGRDVSAGRADVGRHTDDGVQLNGACRGRAEDEDAVALGEALRNLKAGRAGSVNGGSDHVANGGRDSRNQSGCDCADSGEGPGRGSRRGGEDNCVFGD